MSPIEGVYMLYHYGTFVEVITITVIFLVLGFTLFGLIKS